MFESVADEWLRYAKLVGVRLKTDDRRLAAAAEIHTRFGQLDLLLGRLAERLGPGSPHGGEAEHRRQLTAWDWVSIHTDSFYFFAWRLIDLLNGAEGGGFPHLEPIGPAGLLAVRHRLLDHPERQGAYFRHGLEFRDEVGEKTGRAIAVLEGCG